MSTPYVIPLQATPQTLTISLAGIQYQLTVRWNQTNASWIVDIADNNGNPILTGIPMVTGADLLEQFKYLKLGGSLIAQTSSSLYAVPTFKNLGSDGQLYFVTP
jgi:hypothetical protein